MIVYLSVVIDNDTNTATGAGLPVRLDWERRSSADRSNPDYLADAVEAAIREVAAAALKTLGPHVRQREVRFNADGTLEATS